MSASTFCRISCKGIIILIVRAPTSVSLLNVGQVRRKLYGKSWTKPRRELNFKLGDQVRISKSRRTFKKCYPPSWTQEIFNPPPPPRPFFRLVYVSFCCTLSDIFLPISVSALFKLSLTLPFYCLHVQLVFSHPPITSLHLFSAIFKIISSLPPYLMKG